MNEAWIVKHKSTYLERGPAAFENHDFDAVGKSFILGESRLTRSPQTKGPAFDPLAYKMATSYRLAEVELVENRPTKQGSSTADPNEEIVHILFDVGVMFP